MFRIRVHTPAIVDDAGLPHAAALLVVDSVRLRFRIDLRHWSIADYERQWKAGIRRLVEGEAISALMVRYSARSDTAHLMWALWRVDAHVFVQPHCVLPWELEGPLDPGAPYNTIGDRLPVTEARLPLQEWRVAHADVIEAAFQIRWPFAR